MIFDSKMSNGPSTHFRIKNIQEMHARELHDLQKLTRKYLKNYFEDSSKEYLFYILR